MKQYKEEGFRILLKKYFYLLLGEEDHGVNQNKRLFIEIIFLNILYE